MLNYLKYICLLLLLPWLTGCSEEPAADASPAPDTEELPVAFDFAWPDRVGTRGFEAEDSVKTTFQPGDMIHVLGTFHTRYLKDDGSSYEEGTLTRYGALSYDGRNWNAVSGSTLTWPSIAVDGQFTAYYVSDSNGVLTKEDPSATYELSTLTPSTDPLEATSAAGIGYGHAVRLNFTHKCAYLTLVDLEPMVATEYWFHRPLEAGFNNAFQIVLGTGEHGPTLNFEFCQVPDTRYRNLVCIPAQAVERKTTDENGVETVSTRANYFLEPGYYDTFSLCYPTVMPNTFDYLKYDYNNIPDNVGGVSRPNTPPNLEANTTYTLTITKAPGVTIVTPPSADGWDDQGSYESVDVEEFLKAVNQGRGYTNDAGVEILERTANGTKLLHNIDFDYFDYGAFASGDFVPNIMDNSVFDGNHHYIRHLASPLFRYNYGTIQNLGIQDVRIDAVSYEDSDENKDMSRHGSLCMWNRTEATISNVRVMRVEMTVRVRSEINADDEDGSETHNIGGVIGSNTGKVFEVALAGRFSLRVLGTDNNVNASVLIGGFVGQNAATGEIYDVSPLDDALSLDISNACVGDIGSYSAGGIVGESSGSLTGIILSNVRLDGTSSSGVTSYMGGIAGQLAISAGSTASAQSCIVNGSVRAGSTVPHGAITSGSYIGGLAGAVLGMPVLDCRGAVAVYGSSDARSECLYATGGAFGRIRENMAGTYAFENLIAYGSALQAPVSADGSEVATNYTGNFAGIVPKGQDWSDYANKNIIVHVFAPFDYIGKALDSNNNE